MTFTLSTSNDQSTLPMTPPVQVPVPVPLPLPPPPPPPFQFIQGNNNNNAKPMAANMMSYVRPISMTHHHPHPHRIPLNSSFTSPPVISIANMNPMTIRHPHMSSIQQSQQQISSHNIQLNSNQNSNGNNLNEKI